MLKALILLSRRPDLSRDAFDRHLRDTHLALVAQLPGLRRLALNFVQSDPDGPPPDYDAIAEDWFDGPEALQAALASPAGQAVNADAATFVDLSRLRFLVVQEEAVALPASVVASAVG
jgi:uncharacterized protein (TIGR02118 family)